MHSCKVHARRRSGRYTGGMKRLVPIVLFCIATLALAQDPRPAFPKVPGGLNEGRVTLLEEAANEPVSAGDYPARLFEEADLPELARFFHLHLAPAEKSFVAARLGLGDELGRARDADAVLAAIKKKDLRPKPVTAALGELFKDRKYTLLEALAWFNARGFNYRLLQAALNGERIDSFMLSRELREMAEKGKPAHLVFERGVWEYNLKDGRQENGGHYDGVQLTDALLALGWGEAEFAAAHGHKDPDGLSQAQRELIRWGDPQLVWPAIEHGLPESELFKFAVAHYRKAAANLPAVHSVAQRRAQAVRRFFRTGGPGIVGVYEGPWPDNKGNPRPPAASVRELKDGDATAVAAQINGAIAMHFRGNDDSILLAIYEDGSGRAIVRRPKRPAINHGPASPAGNLPSHDQLYEGRVSLKGRAALMYVVHAAEGAVAPGEFELVNLELKASGAFVTADIDDGVQLTPLLLRRTSRLVDAP